jgi:hypothetical protein
MTICGITRSSTGEPDSQSERGEIAGTATEAQAFKRAAAMFGLGRYLYNLPSIWAEYNRETRYFTDKGKAKLEQIIASHYQRSIAGIATEPTEPPTEPADRQTDSKTATIDTKALIDEFDSLGGQLYGDQWDQVKTHNCQRISKGQSAAPAGLAAEQIQRLIDGLKSLQRQRRNRQPQRNGAR